MSDRQWIWEDRKASKWTQAYLDSIFPPDTAPIRKRASEAEYPLDAYLQLIEGSVKVQVLIDDRGNVVKAYVKEDAGTMLGFEEAALEAAKSTEWSPAKKGKKKIPVWTSYSVSFKLPEGMPDRPIFRKSKWEWVVGGLNLYSPSDTAMTPCETRPERLRDAPLRYPEFARKLGITGSVWIKVLIDTDGKAASAIVAKPSGKNAGFEEAALASAIESEWTPAKYKGKPTTIWVTYEVQFRLR